MILNIVSIRKGCIQTFINDVNPVLFLNLSRGYPVLEITSSIEPKITSIAFADVENCCCNSIELQSEFNF